MWEQIGEISHRRKTWGEIEMKVLCETDGEAWLLREQQGVNVWRRREVVSTAIDGTRTTL
jgi:hypothetical protein